MSGIAKTFWYALYLICLVSLIVLIVVSFRPGHASSPAKPVINVNQAKTKVATPAQRKTYSSTTNQSTSSSSSSSSQLSNTGPGNVAAVFIVASLAAALGYRRFMIHRLDDNRLN